MGMLAEIGRRRDVGCRAPHHLNTLYRRHPATGSPSVPNECLYQFVSIVFGYYFSGAFVTDFNPLRSRRCLFVTPPIYVCCDVF